MPSFIYKKNLTLKNQFWMTLFWEYLRLEKLKFFITINFFSCKILFYFNFKFAQSLIYKDILGNVQNLIFGIIILYFDPKFYFILNLNLLKIIDTSVF